MVRRAKLWILLVTLTLIAWTVARPATAVDHNVAGSAQLDYHLVTGRTDAKPSTGTNYAFDGFTLETALKLSADVSEHLSANVKVCYGCHGFEADMAYFDLRADDEFNMRVGRFSPSFGSFNLRHDPGNHKFSDKPLPYDMGRMLRKSTWNSVLPSPFPDAGVELNGTHWFGESVQLDYAIYAVTGFKQSGANPTDISFVESHTPYYVDNNSRPTVGGRIALTGKLSATADVTLGTSAMGGTYDPKNELTYVIAGADFALRIERTTLRMEYLVRRQEFDTTNPGIFKYELVPGRGDFFAKHGAFIEIEQPLTRWLDLMGRVDGMYRSGNVLATSELSSRSSVLRATLGVAIAIDRNFRLKASGEAWQWDDHEAERRRAASFHLGAVGTF